jgi:HIRAN domain
LINDKMSLLHRIFGRHQKSDPSTLAVPARPDPQILAAPARVCELPRGAHVAVHGESFRQDAIRALLPSCTTHPIDGRPTCDVVLVAEPANPYDPNAIAVHASTGHVGYLPRDVAPDFGSVFAELQRLGYSGGRCGALITGGTPDKPSNGIVLLLDYPDVCLRHLRALR